MQPANLASGSGPAAHAGGTNATRLGLGSQYLDLGGGFGVPLYLATPAARVGVPQPGDPLAADLAFVNTSLK